MKPSFYNSTTLKLILQILDLVLINMVFGLFYVVFWILFGKPLLADAKLYWFIGNISYFISINIIQITHQSRIIRPDVIVSVVIRTMVLQILIFLSFLSLLSLPSPSIPVLIAFYVPAISIISLGRLYLNKMLKKARRHLGDARKVVLVGCGENMMEIAEILKYPWNGYSLEGVFADNTSRITPPGVRLLGNVSGTLAWLNANKVDEVYCGLPSAMADDIMPIINYCENNMIRYYSVPNLQNYLKRKMVVHKLDNILVLAIRKEPLSFLVNRCIKRAFDFVISSVFLITLYPIVYIVVGVAVKISSPGPVYFKQQRTGIDGNTFCCIKFRSMKVNTDSDTLQATKNDNRKTRVGDFIRKTNIDELPQFINVWKGEMSIVGPRPHMLKHTEEYSQLINKYMLRHLVKPGITGWAQVKGCRGETKKLSEMANRVKYDIWYLENWTFWLDIVIVIKTILNMFKGEKNAY